MTENQLITNYDLIPEDDNMENALKLENFKSLKEMGFNDNDINLALEKTNNNLEESIMIILNGDLNKFENKTINK